jgi:hypothetical protein
MKRALVSMMVVVASACGAGDAVHEGSVEEMVVLEPTDALEPPDMADLLACIDLPEDLSLSWLKQRLTYNQGCFDSWTINVGVSECPLGSRSVSGAVAIAGNRMAKLPETGFLIRARAASAALLDLTDFAAGKGKPYADIDLEMDNDGATLGACAAPIAGGYHFDVEAGADVPVLGALDLGGSVDLSRVDGVSYTDFAVAISADPPDGPLVRGELIGDGLEHSGADFCPQAGEVRFTGTIGGDAATVVLSYIGDGRAIIELSNGETVGPLVAPRCE